MFVLLFIFDRPVLHHEKSVKIKEEKPTA